MGRSRRGQGDAAGVGAALLDLGQMRLRRHLADTSAGTGSRPVCAGIHAARCCRKNLSRSAKSNPAWARVGVGAEVASGAPHARTRMPALIEKLNIVRACVRACVHVCVCARARGCVAEVEFAELEMTDLDLAGALQA